MKDENLEILRYPIGRFVVPTDVVDDDRSAWIEQIRTLPMTLRKTANDLGSDQLDTPYRDGGWTVRQVIHHLPDSHLNSYVRFKWAITEEEPMIKPYSEQKWSQLHDAMTMDIGLSLDLLSSLHGRWVYFLESLSDGDFRKIYSHPEWKYPLSLHATLSLYAWHGQHHLAHITNLKDRKNW